MTRDYRKGSPPPRRRKEPRGTCAFWFLIGGLLGAFGVGLAWMWQDRPEGAPATAEQTPAPTAPATAAAKPKFDFFSSLAEEEVVVPPERVPEPVELPPPGSQPPLPAAAPAPAPGTAVATAPAAPPVPGSGNYVIQVGSFQRSSDAERLKAQLALLGIQTSIQTVTIDNGQTYHRVRTGTYAKGDAAALQAKLKTSGHKPMMMRAQ